VVSTRHRLIDRGLGTYQDEHHVERHDPHLREHLIEAGGGLDISSTGKVTLEIADDA